MGKNSRLKENVKKKTEEKKRKEKKRKELKKNDCMNLTQGIFLKRASSCSLTHHVAIASKAEYCIHLTYKK